MSHTGENASGLSRFISFFLSICRKPKQKTHKRLVYTDTKKNLGIDRSSQVTHIQISLL